MKNITTLLVIIFSLLANGVKNDYILIEYVGDVGDGSSLHVIYISKKPIPLSEQVIGFGNDFTKNHIVNVKEFNSIKRILHSTSRKTYEKPDYNGFKVTIRENDSLVSYFISRKNSTTMFLKFNDYLKYDKKNEELMSSINGLRLRNVF